MNEMIQPEAWAQGAEPISRELLEKLKTDVVETLRKKGSAQVEVLRSQDHVKLAPFVKLAVRELLDEQRIERRGGSGYLFPSSPAIYRLRGNMV